MSIEISYLISTNRPYQQCAQRVVDGLVNQGCLDNGEIIICSPNPIDDSRVIFCEDQIKINGPLGFNQAAHIAQGNILTVMCDDHDVFIDIDKIVNLFNFPDFEGREYHISTMSTMDDNLHPAYLGPIPGYPRTDTLPRTPMCRFPILDRKTYKKLGTLFHPSFNLKSSFFPDNYLSYFLYTNHEPVIQTTAMKLKSFQHELAAEETLYFDECLNIYLDLIEDLQPGDPYVK